MKIASALTAGSEKIIRSVDYTVDILINESVQTLQHIINDLVAPESKKNMTHYLLLVQNFLKYQYDEHAKKNDDNVSIFLFVFCIFFCFFFRNLSLIFCILHAGMHPRYPSGPFPPIVRRQRPQKQRMWETLRWLPVCRLLHVLVAACCYRGFPNSVKRQICR